MSAPATLTAVPAQAISCDHHANRAVHVAGWVGIRARFTVVAPEGTARPLVITVEDQPDTFAETTAQADEMLAELQIGSG